MKKILFYFIGLFLTHFCSAQIVQATDLLKMHSCTNYDCANSLIEENGYLYSDTPIKQEGKTGYLYTHPTEKKLTTSEQSTINVYHTIVYELNESSSEMVIYYFYGDEEYQDLLKQLETLGFKKLNTKLLKSFLLKIDERMVLLNLIQLIPMLLIPLKSFTLTQKTRCRVDMRKFLTE